jgi:hypothetical protein
MWLKFYHDVRNMQDAPPDHVIEDDEALEQFMRARKSKNEKAEREARLSAAGQETSKGKRTREKIL